jgi:hypothetical protein
MVDEESGHFGWRNNISAEKSVQALKGKMCVPPLVQRQQCCPMSAPALTCVVGLSAISAIADTLGRQLFCEYPVYIVRNLLSAYIFSL